MTIFARGVFISDSLFYGGKRRKMLDMIKGLGKAYAKNFAPKLWEVLTKQKYGKSELKRDAVAGMTVAVVSIPLAMALAIASGVSPAQGLYTAIVAGFFTALLGGCRFQIGGPTGAFVVVIFNVMQQFGYQGLALCMLVAGLVLIVAGFMRLGTYIKYIPYPVVVGFTAGIGLLLFSTQVKDLLGLQIASVPADFLPKWKSYLTNLGSFSVASVFITLFSIAVIAFLQLKKPKMPAYLISVVGATILVAVLGMDIDTIGNKFGGIPHFLPMPSVPEWNTDVLLKIIPSALTIAFLAGVESLLSATVVDGMSGDNTNSNAELIGQGVANIMSMFFGGVPATGAIARTATNFKSRAFSPMAAILQSVFLLLFMWLLSSLAAYIPLAALAVVLCFIAWNMMNFEKIYKLLQGPKGDRYTLIVTLLLTILVDLNTAISVGFIMASIIFMHRMSREIEIANDDIVLQDVGGGRDLTELLRNQGVMSLRLSGPLFFGGASQVSHFFSRIDAAPKVLILRMGYVPVVDATGANIIVEFVKKIKKYDTKIIFSNIKTQPRRVLHDALLKENVDWHTISTATTFQNALKMARRYLKHQAEEGKAA